LLVFFWVALRVMRHGSREMPSEVKDLSNKLVVVVGDRGISKDTPVRQIEWSMSPERCSSERASSDFDSASR
jgi:hypothetical protein